MIAVDWSGAKDPRGRLWLAVSDQRTLVDLVSCESREVAVDRLLSLLAGDSSAVCGLDFAFSMPAWFVQSLGASHAFGLWAVVEREGEGWLHRCEAPFWGRSGKPKPSLPGHFRETEMRVSKVRGISPKSVFQVGGAGSVGTGSIRGMPFLRRIREAGYAVWPFDPPRRPLVIEMYPRVLSGPVIKTSPTHRSKFLDRHCDGISPAHRALAAASDDAFDAAVSALRLEECLQRLAFPPSDPVSRIEGAIWPERVCWGSTFE